MDIAAVIVTYKSAQFTVAALDSLCAERSDPQLRIRAIVVDNASGDLPLIEQAVIANGWSSWVTLVAAPRNGGFAYGNNMGIERAYTTGAPSYIFLLNPDAQVRRGAIGILARFLEANPSIGIAGSSFETPAGVEWPIAFRFPSLLSELNQGLEFGMVTRVLKRWVVPMVMTSVAQPVDWICGASMMIRPTVLSATGGMDENFFLYFEETDLCRRARIAGFPTWYVPDSRVMHIGGQSTKLLNSSAAPARLPWYWFDSRRRYFAVTFGIGHAIAIDVVAILAYLLGSLKRVVLGRRRMAVPYYVRDLIRHSIIWPQNRYLPDARCTLRPGALSSDFKMTYVAKDLHDLGGDAVNGR